MAGRPTQEFVERPTAISMVAPRVRTVAIGCAWPESGHTGPDSGDGLEVYPVTAIVGLLADVYSTIAGDDDRPDEVCPETVGAYVGAGWRHRRLFKFDHLIRVHEEFLHLAGDYFGDGYHPMQSYRIVECPWPAEEDSDRLEPFIRELREYWCRPKAAP